MADLGITIEEVGEELHSRIPAVPELAVPGTTALRLSALAALADTQLGLLGVREIAPRIPVTLELDVHLFEPVPVGGAVRGVARVVKSGQSVVVSAIDLLDEGGRPIGVGTSIFMAAPDPELRIPTGRWALDLFREPRGSLREPYARRLRCERTAPGVASMPFTPEVSNSARTLNGGAVPLAIEEAVLSASPGTTTLASLSIQYLRPVRRGPAVATADIHGDVGTVEVRDASNDVLAFAATARTFPAVR
jgi:acyl-coenzyme A thioesterase PaaI-like protein